jgi:hypothetical protein
MSILHSARRAATRVGTILLLAGAGLVVPFSGAAHAAATCTGTYQLTCVDTTSINNTYDYVTHFSTKFVNTKSGTATGTCTVSTSKTTTASITSTISVGTGVIFAKADASVSGSLEASVTSSIGTSVSFPVPGNSTRYCKYGTSRSKVSGTVKKYNCSSQGCILTASGTWTVIGPKTLTWTIS